MHQMIEAMQADTKSIGVIEVNHEIMHAIVSSHQGVSVFRSGGAYP